MVRANVCNNCQCPLKITRPNETKPKQSLIGIAGRKTYSIRMHKHTIPCNCLFMIDFTIWAIMHRTNEHIRIDSSIDHGRSFDRSQTANALEYEITSPFLHRAPPVYV